MNLLLGFGIFNALSPFACARSQHKQAHKRDPLVPCGDDVGVCREEAVAGVLNNKLVLVVDFDENVFHHMVSVSVEVVFLHRRDRFEPNAL